MSPRRLVTKTIGGRKDCESSGAKSALPLSVGAEPDTSGSPAPRIQAVAHFQPVAVSASALVGLGADSVSESFVEEGAPAVEVVAATEESDGSGSDKFLGSDGWDLIHSSQG